MTRASLERRLQRLEQRRNHKHLGVLKLPEPCPPERWAELVEQQMPYIKSHSTPLEGRNGTRSSN
jgi:hypothetical protein